MKMHAPRYSSHTVSAMFPDSGNAEKEIKKKALLSVLVFNVDIMNDCVLHMRITCDWHAAECVGQLRCLRGHSALRGTIAMWWWFFQWEAIRQLQKPNSYLNRMVRSSGMSS